MGEKVCVQNPTLKSVAPKYRDFVKEALKKLESHFSSKNYNDTWELRVYHKEYAEKSRFGRYILMLWEDPYSLKISIYPDRHIVFEMEDTDFGTYLLRRFVPIDNIHIGEVDYFIDSVENILEVKRKMLKFTNNYRSDELPSGYKRNEKIEQLLS